MQRVPELNALTGDSRIRRAIESGDTFKVYRSLVLARLFRRLPAHAALLRELTAERRLFAKPLKGMPSLANYNSLGFGLVGQSERDKDGVHVALHAIVALFKVPLVPLGAYVVQGTSDQGWTVYARAPLGVFGWFYARALVLALVLLAGWGAHSAYQASRIQELVLLNGFGETVSVTIDKQSVALAPQGRLTLKVATGKVHGAASAGKGGLIDTFDHTLDGSSDIYVWNIAGAMPLLHNTLYYSKVKPAPGAPGRDVNRVHCGRQFMAFDDIDHLFTEAPESVTTSDGADHTYEQLSIATKPGTPGVMLCLGYLHGNGMEANAAKAHEALAQLQGWDYQGTSTAVLAAQSVSPAEALRVARRAVEARPDDVQIARVLQDMRDNAGESVAQLSEHRQRARKQPDSAREQYLYLSLLSGNIGQSAADAMARRFPQDPQILRSLARRKAVRADYAGASAELARLHRLSEEDAGYLIDDEARVLVALGRAPAALKLLDAALANKTSAAGPDLAADHGLVARLAGADPERFLRANYDGDADPAKLDRSRVRAGLDLLEPASAEDNVVQIALALRQDPGKALALAQRAGRFEMLALSGDQMGLLYGEAVRSGRTAVSDKLAFHARINLADRVVLHQYLRGENVNLAEIDIGIDFKAAAHFIRSRNAKLSDGERAELRSRAARGDLLQGVISTAIKQWKEPSTP
ncbi:hypothetical protein C7C56_002015 [Massilia glaciei]|uniref:Uncharacterized protein n=1 Tax=Massilia glaciei TaxID=1524097 RepID=A0A2U2I6M5_9BURK|nr:hypothetical protein C7C56_002015 [Massilia glaciei]